MPQAGVCLAAHRVTARLVIRQSTAAHIAWPLLVIDPCPWSLGEIWEIPRTHAHVHVMSTPGPWLRSAPCNRQPYLITLDGAA